MAVNTQEKEALISCGLNLSNISGIEGMKTIINNKGLDIASEIILDLRDRINRLTDYISKQKEENILYYDKVFNL